MDQSTIPGIIKQSPWQLDFPYLHTVMALPERHTDVSIHGFIEISSNTEVYLNHHFIFSQVKTRDKQLSKFQNFHSSIWIHNINFSRIFYLNTMHA